MRFQRITAAAILGLLAAATTVRGDLFDLSVTGSSTNINAKGSSVPDLVDDLLNSDGKFKDIDGQSYNASLKYGDVNNAITLQSNATGTDGNSAPLCGTGQKRKRATILARENSAGSG